MSRRFFAYRSFEPEYDTMRRMRALGIDTFTFMVSNATNFMGMPYTRYQPTWIWERTYDFALFDQNVRELLAAVPDAKLICKIDVNPPAWWLRRGKCNAARADSFRELGRVMSLPEWREDVAHYLQALLRHAEKNFGETIVAYHLGGGFTTEWFDRSEGQESHSRSAAFQQHVRDCGLPVPETVPDRIVRYTGSHELTGVERLYPVLGSAENDRLAGRFPSGLFRTPAENRHALEFWRFNSQELAETLKVLLRQAREVIKPETTLALCYGYVFELWGGCQASYGQLEYEQIFAMQEVDLAVEPFSYGAQRGMGGSPTCMIPMQTLKVRGKHILNTIDATTFTSRFPAAPTGLPVSICGRKVEWTTPEAVAAGLKREIAFTLVNQGSTWLFDQWGGWWDSDAAMDTIKRAKDIWDEEVRFTPQDAFEVLLVVDPFNMYYLNDARPDVVKFVNPARLALAGAGVSYTTASFNDLRRMDLSAYKLVILCHPFDLDDGRLELLQNSVMGNERSIMWFYGPGVIHQGKWDEAHVAAVCGTAFQTPGISSVKMPWGYSIYVSAPDSITAEDMRNIARQAEVHIWCDKKCPVYANSRLAAIHLGKSEQTTLIFPRKCRKITELYTGQSYTDTDRVEICTQGPDTLLFRYE